MPQYFVQFVAGTGSLVSAALGSQLDQPRVGYADDSAMVLETRSPFGRVAAVPFLKNSFAVVARTGRGSVADGIIRLSRAVETKTLPRFPEQPTRFRVMAHLDGSLTHIEQRAKIALERAIATRTGARVEPRGMCQEYWIIGRQGMRELLLCARLPKSRKLPKEKGAVSHELSAMLVAASRPEPEDIFLDPFGGSGSFISARLGLLPAKKLWYSDRALPLRRPGFPPQLTDKRVGLLAEDALQLPSVLDGSIDVIVTDPPWGEHEDIGRPYDEFARMLAASFARVLHPRRGRYVLLVSRRNANAMGEGLRAASLPPLDEHEILVNGHPATVLIGRRTRALTCLS